MSRFEGEFRAVGVSALDLSELSRIMADPAFCEGKRQAAIACYLSTSEGWRDAGQLLGGTFAGGSSPGRGAEGAARTGLNEGEER